MPLENRGSVGGRGSTMDKPYLGSHGQRGLVGPRGRLGVNGSIYGLVGSGMWGLKGSGNTGGSKKSGMLGELGSGYTLCGR